MALTWLHVSDFHLSDKGAYSQEVILRSLVSSVRQFREKGEQVPDLIFATGDIAQNGKAKEYDAATKFFDDLLEAAGLNRDRLFIIPGNHDVDRKMGKGLERTFNTKDDVDEYFDPQTPTPHLTQKFQAFSSWYNSYFSGIRSFPTNTTCSPVEILTINNCRIAVLPLNSALFSIDDRDVAQLFIGRLCLDNVREQLKRQAAAELTIALIHHPLDWLSQVERSNIKAALGESVDLLLHGHCHEIDAESIASANGGFIKLAAGAAYQTRKWPNSAMYVTFEGNRVTIFPIRYEDSPNEKWTLDTSVFPSPLYTGTFFLSKGTSAASPESDKLHHPCKERYQATLKEELGYIRMLGLPGVESVKVNLNDDTFVPLRMSDRQEKGNVVPEKSFRQGGEHIFSPDEIMKRAFRDRRGCRMLLVIGDPGSGKTTLLKYYALRALEDSARLGFSDPVNVFYLPLRELSSHAGHYDTLPANLASWSVMQHHAIKKECFVDWLQSGTSLVLLDGLDEISNTQERIEVCKWIDAALNTFTVACFVVTSRATGYRKDEGVELAADYERADVQDFTSEQQERFLKNWFKAAFLKEPCEKGFEEAEWQEKQQKEAEARTITIVEHLNAEKNKGLRQLAAIPMILQIMAILWKDREYMPDSRVKLYEASLDYLLEFRDKRRGIVPLLSALRARQVLAPLSLWMQEKLKKDEASRVEMHKKMKEQLDKQDKPPSVDDFCDYLVKRSGLLVETGAHDYLFRHKSFREYLAGVQLVTKVRSTRYLGNLIAGFGNDWWDEPIRFFIAQGDEEIFNLFMKKLFDSPVSDELTPKQQWLLQTLIEEAPLKKVDALCTKLLVATNTASRQRVILDCLKTIGKSAAIKTLEQFKTRDLAKNKDVADRADEVMYTLQELKDKTAQSGNMEKAAPKTITSQIINFENRPISFRNPNEHNAEYILIKKGSYLDSETKKQKNAEKDLYFAKYPVTNKLYRSFIAALGESSKLQEELKKIAKNNSWDAGFSGYFNKGENDLAALFCSENDEDRKFGGDDQPVVGITWYAAQAYCLWLSQCEDKPDSYRLPTEVEWEWAAGGRQGTIGKKVRKYPWADEKREPDSKLLNYDGNVGATTPVGSYPEGATPEGLYDMAGNVWEWTDSWYNEETCSNRVIRGGSWDDDAGICRSAYRSGYTPDYRDYDVGFRPVFVP